MLPRTRDRTLACPPPPRRTGRAWKFREQRNAASLPPGHPTVRLPAIRTTLEGSVPPLTRACLAKLALARCTPSPPSYAGIARAGRASHPWLRILRLKRSKPPTLLEATRGKDARCGNHSWPATALNVGGPSVDAFGRIIGRGTCLCIRPESKKRVRECLQKIS